MTGIKDMAMDKDMVKVRGERPPVRLGLLVAGGAMTLVGGVLLVEELTDLLRGRSDIDETFGALVAIALGLTALAAGGLLGQGPRRLGAGFGLATGGIAIGAAAAAFGLGGLVDLGTSGALVVAAAVLVGVLLAGGLLAAVVDRRWGLAAGLAVAAVLLGVGVVAVLVAAVASGSEVPDWVWMLDD